MSFERRAKSKFAPSAAFVLLCALLTVLFIAGGASRADALGQVIVRVAATIALMASILLGLRPSLGPARPVAFFLAAAVLLVLVQLVPLPPDLWQALPGREPFTRAATLMGEVQPWRPIAIVPGSAMNAASSLIVPVAVLALLSMLPRKDGGLVMGVLLCGVALSTLVGLIQFSGTGMDNPLVNETVGQISGMFANRNHFALFLACGCLLAPCWAFAGPHRASWRIPVAIGLILLFVVSILASGSRAGIVVGALALGCGFFIVRSDVRRALAGYPRWLFAALIISLTLLIAILVLISFAADRAVSIQRMFDHDIGSDMRSRGLDTVIAMIRAYFPIGAGFGSFDAVFRMHEPFDLLKPTYFNHAHNDWIEVALDGGIAGALLLAAALAWWGWMSWRAWFGASASQAVWPRLGSAILLLIFVGSLFDYPARTPVMMAVVVIAAWWLSHGAPGRPSAPLPADGQHL